MPIRGAESGRLADQRVGDGARVPRVREDVDAALERASASSSSPRASSAAPSATNTSPSTSSRPRSSCELQRPRRRAASASSIRPRVARDERAVGQGASLRRATARARCKLGGLREPARRPRRTRRSSRGTTPSAQQTTGRQRRLRPFELGRTAGVRRAAAPESPHGDRASQRGEARLDRAEPVGKRPRVEVAQAARPRRSPRPPPRASRRARAPRLRRAGAAASSLQQLAREPLEPGEHRRMSTDVARSRSSAAAISSPASANAPACERVLDRLVDRAVVAMPRERAAVKRRREARLAMLELDAQQLREEVMEAVPLASIVERQEEQVRARERGQQLCRSPPARARRRTAGRTAVRGSTNEA